MENNRVYITSAGFIVGSKHDANQKYYKIESEKFEPMLEHFQIRNVDRISKLSLAAAAITLMRRCVLESDFKIEKGECNDYGVILGTQYSAFESIHNYDMEALEKGALAVNPGLFPNTVLNSPACQVSIQCSFAGPVYTVCNGLTSSLDAIGMGYNFVRTGSSSMVLAGGVDEITELQTMMNRNDKELGESVGFLMLESDKSLTKKEKRAEIIGYKSKAINKEQKLFMFETVSDLINGAVTSRENNLADITNISLGSYLYSKESENILTDICKKINFYGDRECIGTDWMGTYGIVQASKALDNLNVTNGENAMWVLVNLDKEKVAVLVLKSV